MIVFLVGFAAGMLLTGGAVLLVVMFGSRGRAGRDF
jgi:hypothetical protein